MIKVKSFHRFTDNAEIIKERYRGQLCFVEQEAKYAVNVYLVKFINLETKKVVIETLSNMYLAELPEEDQEAAQLMFDLQCESL